MSNKIRSLTYEVKGSDVPAHRKVGDNWVVPTSGGCVKISISRIVEVIDPDTKEQEFLFYAKNEQGEEGLWKKKNRFFEVEYDVIDLWK